MDPTSNSLREHAAPAARSQATRFKKGRSGNPKGRPKARKLLSVIIREAMGVRIPIVQGGKRKRITKAEALVQLNLNDAIKGDASAIDFVISLAEKAGGLVPAELERQGGVLVVPGVSRSREEWERLHGAAARGEQNYDNDGLPKRAPITVPLSLEAGDKLMAAGKFDQGLACYRNVFDIAVSRMKNKDDPASMKEAFNALMKIGNMGYWFIPEGRFEDTLACADAAISILSNGQPDKVAESLIWLNLQRAMALMFLDRVDEAREGFTVHMGKKLKYGNRLKTWERIVILTFDFYRDQGAAHPLMDDVEQIFAGD